MHLVIVGGVAAGTKAAARARRVNKDIAITLFQDESEVSYTACGQPYYLSGLVPKRDTLIIRRAADFKAEGIDIRLRSRVTALNVSGRTIEVRDLVSGAINTVEYDRLILATGARAIIPTIPGTRSDGVVTLRSMAELDRFCSTLKRLQPKNALIVGAGYIALEVAESLHALGISTTLLVRKNRVFSRLDPEMGERIHAHLVAKDVRVVFGEEPAEIVATDARVSSVITKANLLLPAELVVLALGTQPNVELAEQAGLQLGRSGAIAVDAHMETSIKGIFAAGDCAESLHRITKQPVWEPLGDIANLQGRVAGENAAGGNAEFPGVFGTTIFKTFDLNVGFTGLTEAAAHSAGFATVSTLISARDKARYYPGTREVVLKLVAEASNGRLLGAQALGPGAVDKMIDIAATALLGKLSCRDLENADLAYAPPFSPVLSPMIVAAADLCKKLDAANKSGNGG